MSRRGEGPGGRSGLAFLALAVLLAAALPVRAQPAGMADEEQRPALQDPADVAAAPQPPRGEKRLRLARDDEPVPGTLVLALGLGAEAGIVGGYARPKIVLKGRPDDGFWAHALGGAAKLTFDFPALDLDWRIALSGALPAFGAASALVGIRTELSPWENPRVVARGGVGLEMVLGGAQRGAVFMVPLALAEAEAALEIDLVRARLALIVALDLALRYGVPAGVGASAGGYVRAAWRF